MRGERVMKRLFLISHVQFVMTSAALHAQEKSSKFPLEAAILH
jgi:hypothetical protein